MTAAFVKIAIAGRMGSGKTAVTAALQQLYAPMHRVSFADPVKAIGRRVAALLGVDPEDKAAMRPLLVAIGLGGRDFDPDFWVDALMLRQFDDGSLVNDDTRKENEAAAFLQTGWLVYKLSVPDDVRAARLAARDGGYDRAQLESDIETAVDGITSVTRTLANATPADFLELLGTIAADVRERFDVPVSSDRIRAAASQALAPALV